MNAPAFNPDTDIADLWRMGELSWKLDDHQLEVYDLFHEWDARRKTAEYERVVEETGATLDDVWVEEIGRRFGKTAKWIVMLFEIAIRRPGSMLTYACAAQKSIGQIIVPMANEMSADCPSDLRPKYQGTRGALHEGLYFPDSNGSVIKLVGIDEHPDALRGQFSDGVVISEAGFVRGLNETVRSVLLPQFQRRPWAFLALESSTSKQLGHDFLREFVPDAKLRGAYVMRTIDDNHAISAKDKAKFIREAGGLESALCKREYYCIAEPDPETTIVPEFDPKRHVVPPGEVPQYAHCYEACDPGTTDLMAVVWAFWDARRQKLVVQRSWAKANESTENLSKIVKDTERELWRGLTYYDGARQLPNPLLRVIDPEPAGQRIIVDMRTSYGLIFMPTDHTDADAALFALRDAFKNDRIEIWEDSGPCAGHLEAGSKNPENGKWDRHPLFGHFDCIAALRDLWRNVKRDRDPYPPAIPDPAEQFTREDVSRLREPARVRALNDVMGRGGMRVRLKGRGR